MNIVNERLDVDTEIVYVITLVQKELLQARLKHPDFPSEFHGVAVIEEEIRELWDAIRAKQLSPRARAIELQKEAVQIAAMGIRFVMDVCRKERVEGSNKV